MTTYIIQHLAYVGKLSDLLLNLEYSLAGMSEPSVKARLLAKWMKGIPEMLKDQKYFPQASGQEEKFKEFRERAEAFARESYVKRFSESQQLVLNLNLVMMCTTLELFFEHVLDILFRAEPMVLHRLASEKTISLEQVMKIKFHEDVMDFFRNKTTDRIIRDGVKDVVRSFDKIGIRTKEVFSWDGYIDDFKTKFAGWNEDKLNSIFQERHSIVHDNQLPLARIEDLLIRMEFIRSIIINVSLLSWQKFQKCGVILDAHEFIRKQIASEGGDPSLYPPLAK